MSDQPDYGNKGYCLASFFLALFLFVILWAYVYYSNGELIG